MEELKKKYDQMLKDIETASIFDGRGTGVDVYICEKCGERFYTQYTAKGVTPFTIGCRFCKAAIMLHKTTISYTEWLKLEFISGAKLHNWVRPTYEQMIKLSPLMQQHVLKGGLVLEEELS